MFHPLFTRGQAISWIRPIDLRLVNDLVDFIRGRGYVLGFSDSSFAAFFVGELNVDIDDPAYAEQHGSKGKRLRCFLQKVDDASAVQTLRALWEHCAEWLAHTGQLDPVPNTEGRAHRVQQRRRGDARSILPFVFAGTLLTFLADRADVVAISTFTLDLSGSQLRRFHLARKLVVCGEAQNSYIVLYICRVVSAIEHDFAGAEL
ncbi:hypothetical protein [Xanthobacter autotrophicus]|uniref:hypothetical protein n=1 Tax=Xanthobacter autotrophicus TaxID=280 RepID=UPI0024A683A4|nr:hypothetical protein [Xanthobacter autotrophicus]MDI4657531.1 hypothetical protein [Xanthobacter autotrophicus]